MDVRLQFCYYLPMQKKVWPFHLKKLKSSLPRDAFCQFWRKWSMWFYRRRFFNFRCFCYYLPFEKYFVIILPWKSAWPFIWINKYTLHPRMICAKFDWNWLSGSGEEVFFKSSMYFRYFVFISRCKRAKPFIWTNLNSLHPRMHCAKFSWNWPSGSGEKI